VLAAHPFKESRAIALKHLPTIYRAAYALKQAEDGKAR
jgi:hypothetical protein